MNIIWTTIKKITQLLKIGYYTDFSKSGSYPDFSKNGSHPDFSKSESYIDSPIKLTSEQLSQHNALNYIKDNIAQYQSGLANIEDLINEHDHLQYVIFESQQTVFSQWELNRLFELRAKLPSYNQDRSRILECLDLLNNMFNPDWQFRESEIHLDEAGSAAYTEVIQAMHNDPASSDILEYVKSKGIDPLDHFVPLSVTIERLQDKLASTDPDAETEDRLSALSLPRRMREPVSKTTPNEPVSETIPNEPSSVKTPNEPVSETIPNESSVKTPDEPVSEKAPNMSPYETTPNVSLSEIKSNVSVSSETKSNDLVSSETKSNVSVSSEEKSNDSPSEIIQKSEGVSDPIIKHNTDWSKTISWDLYNKTFNKSNSSKQEKNKSTVDFTIEKQETEMPDYFDDID